mgnify:CR=1 FL=1
MLAWISYVNESLNKRLDSLSVLPVAFAAVLGLLVIATAVFEDPAAALAASHVGRVAG